MQFFSMNWYEKTSEPIMYKMNKDGKTEQISGPTNKKSPRDYLAQKLVAIQTLKDYIDTKGN